MPKGNTPDLPDTRSTDMFAEMAAFDALGPLTRAAINDARFPMGAEGLLVQFLELEVDPTDPAVDRAGAKATRECDAKLAFRFAQAEGRLDI